MNNKFKVKIITLNLKLFHRSLGFEVSQKKKQNFISTITLVVFLEVFERRFIIICHFVVFPIISSFSNNFIFKLFSLQTFSSFRNNTFCLLFLCLFLIHNLQEEPLLSNGLNIQALRTITNLNFYFLINKYTFKFFEGFVTIVIKSAKTH